MSPDPNQSSQSSKSAKSASPSPAEAETQANSAPEPSSPAEPMTDQPANSMLATPPTRMTPSDAAASEQDTPTTAEPSASGNPSSTPVPEPEAVERLAEAPKAPAEASEASDATTQLSPSLRHQPIPPASEPMQYRAIGLVRGKYTPSEEQFTRGFILTDDEVLIDAVLLGRVMSLVKKHINLEESHLWVVYPRTRERDLELHMQIVGVWEPDKLNRSDDFHMDDSAESDTDVSAEDAEHEIDEESPEAELTPELDQAAEAEVGKAAETTATDLPSPEDLDDRYFSVRGEVVYQSEEEQRLLVKIRRSPKQGSTQAKAFKVALKGVLEGKALGYFWDLQVQRENNELVIKEAVQIGMVPPQKRTGGSGDRPPRRGPGGSGPRRGGQASGPPRKRWQDNREGARPPRSARPSDRPGERPSTDRTAAPPTPRQPISKPIKRRPKDEES